MIYLTLTFLAIPIHIFYDIINVPDILDVLDILLDILLVETSGNQIFCCPANPENGQIEV